MAYIYGIASLLVAIFCCSQVFVESKWACSTCGVHYVAIGCYKDNFNRPLPEQLINERDVTSKVYGGRKIDWYNWNDYMAGFACRCAKAAKAKGYSVFGLQFYGECWSGPDGDSYDNVGQASLKDCVGPDYKPCSSFDRHCNGKPEVNFIYRIVPDCDLQVEAIGCYADKHIKSHRPLPGYVLTDRDPTLKEIYSGHSIDWRNWDVYMPEFICRCAKKAKAMNKATFAVQYYGECWVATENDVQYGRDGPSSACIDKCYDSCHPYDKYCSGKRYANFVYRLADQPCEWKITPVGCYKEVSSSRALQTAILDEMDPTSPLFKGEVFKIADWDGEFSKLLCRCAREAKKRGFVNFGVYNTATCWGSSDANAYKKHGASSECRKKETESCSSGSNDCAGGKESMFVYSVAA